VDRPRRADVSSNRPPRSDRLRISFRAAVASGAGPGGGAAAGSAMEAACCPSQNRISWLLDPSDQLAARLAHDGDSEPFHIEENETTFTIDWKGRYRIEGAAFVYMDQETERLDTIHGYPTHNLIQRGCPSDPGMAREIRAAGRPSQGGRQDRGVSRTRCNAQSEARSTVS
jgi:hypothetical protein